MDSTAVAAAAITILSPYLAKAGEEIARNTAQAAWKKAAEIHEAIKTRFAQEEDDYPAQTFQRYEANPEKRSGAMQDVLEEVLDKDAEFSQSLTTLLKEADNAGAGSVFNVQVFGGTVGEIISIDKLEGGLTINKSSKQRKSKKRENSSNRARSEPYSLLRKNLVAYFNSSELRTICFDLGLDYENLRGDTKEELALELVSYCERRNIISDLVAVCKEQRPNVENWT